MVSLGGGLSGAATGAQLGSAFGPWGIGIGGALGGLAGLFGSERNSPGSEDQLLEFNRYSPDQMSLLKQLQGYLTGSQQPSGGLLGDLFSEPDFNALTAPYQRQFEEEIVPALAERFTAQGGRNSSAFQQALGAQGSKLAENLAALRAEQGMSERNRKQNLMNSILQQVLQPRTNQYFREGFGGATEATPLGGLLAQLAPQAFEGLYNQGRNWFDNRKNAGAAT